jgi:tRNA wybutosine-synthesizing protein 1
MLSADQIERLERAGYRVLGSGHSAVKVCHWTKRSLVDRGTCYKEQFYGGEIGLRSHRCLQFTPALPFCDHRCAHCWRDTSLTTPEWRGPSDDPALLLDQAIEAQRELLSGFGGNPSVNRRKLGEALDPKHCAISLAGEPTLYPRLGDLIRECGRRGMTSFVVSNGLHPEVLASLDPLPTQLYISVVAPNREVYRRVCNPLRPDGWERLVESLEVMSGLRTRRAVRITAIGGVNMREPEGYARLIALAEPDFVEVKGYMWVGYSRARMRLENMPAHQAVLGFARRVAECCGYRIVAESEASRAVLLVKEK